MSYMAQFIKGCATCQPEFGFISIQSLHDSNSIGYCTVCSILSGALSDDKLRIPADCPESSWASLYLQRPSFPLSNLHISRKKHPDGDEYERVAHLEIYTPDSTVSPTLIQHGTDVNPHLSLNNAVYTTRKWLESCLERHRHPVYCSQIGWLPLPRRVLDISRSDTGNISLVEKKEAKLEPANGGSPYATLSYCWGTEKNGQSTTMANIFQRMIFFNKTELSQTFQDAISFAHALKIKYLWIDSLCIIQDHESDRATEIRNMGGIYRHSNLNISATSGPDSNHGLFNPRWAPEISAPARRNPVDSFKVGNFEFPSNDSNWKVDVEIMVRFSLCRSHEDIKNRSDSLPGIDLLSPLLNRGWALQERILSRRTVSFHSTELTWDCDNEIKCECGTSSSVNQTSHDSGTSWSPHFTKQHLTMLSLDTACYQWHNLVSQYSTSKLTIASDYFPALSGIASYFHGFIENKLPFKAGMAYYAGLWRYNLVRDLCWYVAVSENLGIPSRAKPYRAPTWSWASVDFYDGSSRSPTVYHSYIQKSFEQFTRFTIRYAETQLDVKYSFCHGQSGILDIDPYGAVSGGTLRIRGVLLEARIFVHPRRGWKDVGRHTIQFSEEDPLDQYCPPAFLPSLYLDVFFKEPGQRYLSSDTKKSPVAITQDWSFHHMSLKRKGKESMGQEEVLCEGSKVWVCMVGKILGGGICALALIERGRANFPQFERIGYLYNEVETQNSGLYLDWSNSFMRRVGRAKETVIEIL
ncbi:hypothetical protein NHQ30_011554 [Ciborinia camelliae]|nr:hypothetical protein NHQ30_011554 [Ciborinia camelliae]